MLEIAASPKNQVSLVQGNVSHFGDKHVSNSGDTIPIGRQYEKNNIFYYKKAYVKTSWDDTSPSRPKFDPLHQENSPLR